MEFEVNGELVSEGTPRMNRLSRRKFVRLSAAAAVSLYSLRRASAQVTDPGSGPLEQGRRYHDGDGVAVNYNKAVQLFQQAAEAGSLNGQAWLGNMYLRGRGVERDEAKGANLIRASAEAGSPVGLRFAGVLYQEGRTVPQDYGKAREYFEQAGAAGDAVAYGRLGMLHLFGRGGTADVGKARSYLGLGAVGGDPWSMVELGKLYKHDHNKTDRATVFALYTQAAQRGNRVGAYCLACAYHFGIGTEKDPVATLKFVKQSASKGYPPAQVALGSLYAKGKSVAKDLQRAYALYTLASRQGNQEATSRLRAISKGMTVQEIHDAVALADSFRAKNPQSKDLLPGNL